jgi:hypothetical protein
MRVDSEHSRRKECSQAWSERSLSALVGAAKTIVLTKSDESADLQQARSRHAGGTRCVGGQSIIKRERADESEKGG